MAWSKEAIDFPYNQSGEDLQNALVQLLNGNYFNKVSYGSLTAAASVVQLSTITGGIPDWATMATVVVVADTSSSRLDYVINFTEDGTTPETGHTGKGMPLGNLQYYHIKGREALTEFRFISTTAQTQSLRVTFYGKEA